MTLYAYVLNIPVVRYASHHTRSSDAKHDGDRLLSLSIVSKKTDFNCHTSHNIIEETKSKQHENYRRVGLRVVQSCVRLRSR